MMRSSLPAPALPGRLPAAGLALAAMLFTLAALAPGGGAGEPPPGIQEHPALAASGDTIYAAWTDGRDGTRSALYWTRFTGPAPDTAAAPATTATASELRPAVAAGPGWALAAWESWTGTGVRLGAAGLPAAGPPGPLSPVLVTTGPGPVWRPAAAILGSTAVLVWEDERDAPGDLYLARWDRGSGLRDPGGVPLALGADEDRWPAAAAGPGGFLLAWSSASPGGNATVRVRALDRAGEPTGTACPLAPPAPGGPIPTVAWSGDRYLVAWRDFGEGDGDLAGRFVSAAGVPLGPGPFALTGSRAVEYGPRLAPSGTGWDLVWTVQDATGRALRRARVDTTGTLHPPEGLLLTDPGDWAADAAVAARAGTLAAAWRVPGALDDDDLYAAEAAPGDTAAPPAPALLTVVPGTGASTGVGDRARPGGESPPAPLAAAPNPFRGVVRFPGEVGPLEVFDLAGRRVARIAAPPGTGTAEWSGRGGDGIPVPPGVYWVRRAGGKGSVRVVRLP